MTGTPPETGEEIDRMLARALVTFERTDREGRRLSRRETGSYLLAAVVMTATTAIATRLATPTGALVAVVMLLATVAGLLWVQVPLRSRRAELLRRRRSMMAMVDDVREVFPLVARRENWAPARRESVRKLLSRFPVDVV